MDQHGNAIRGIGRIGILRDQSRLQTAHIVEPGCCRRQERNIRQSSRRLWQPHFGAPGEDASTRIDGAGYIEELRRTLWIPAMLILARPLHPHWTADRARENRGIGGGVFVTVHAVTSGAFDVDEPYRFLGQAKEASGGVAIAMRTL